MIEVVQGLGLSELSEAPASLSLRANVVEYLRRCGLRRAEDCEITVALGRNTAVRVTLPDGRGLFLKQGRNRGIHGDGALLNEGLFHFYAESRGLARRGDYLVRCRLHDRRSDVLVFDRIMGSETLRERVSRTGRLSMKASYAIGASLGEIHSVTSEDQSPDVVALGRGTGSLIPEVTELTPEILADLSAGDVEILQNLQGDEVFSNGLSALNKTWKHTCLIHGDFRMENILIRKEALPSSPLLVDWELCRYGDPAADLGSFIGDVVRVCIDRVRPSNLGLSDWILDATTSLRRLSRGVVAFWEGYRHAVPNIATTRPSLPVLAMAHAGVFLLNRAGASSQMLGRFRVHDLMYIAIARRFITDPVFGLRKILGASVGAAV